MTANATLIEGRTGGWEIILGLEVHAQVVSKSKLFSGAATEFGAEPNTQSEPGRCRRPACCRSSTMSASSRR
jgi:Asp-tRNA(Asn)/Glu-tRNA(Gln) amidotransferase B subunit